MAHSIELVFDSHDPAAVRRILDRAIRRASGSFQTTERRGEAVVILTGASEELIQWIHRRAMKTRVLNHLVTGIVIRRRE